ncbi:MAG: prolyl oligopeptidase family serine peptidase [Bacteroidales bacterium]|nr:prolyl oligopeptidase family serine peptidase [Bacteroidales bacterium]MDD4057973.1 prolyl oligopeptidase family serine peptidase [Bacteroidales bacterium]
MKFTTLPRLFTMIFVTTLFYAPIYGQENLNYQTPPKEILELADYERTPAVMIDSHNKFMIFTYRNTYKSLDELNQPELRLAGLRINPVVNISSTVTYINNLKIRKVGETSETQFVGLPSNPKISNIQLSPDEKNLAFTHTTDSGVELWVANIESRRANKLFKRYLNANMGNPICWSRDGSYLIVRVLPQNRRAIIDESKNIPNGPIVSISEGKVSQNRTYQDLLKNKNDEINFETIASSELWRVGLKEGDSNLFLKADIYASESFSPDGEFIMITTIEQPYSYIVPLNRFPQISRVYSKDGELIKEVNSVPLIEIQPKGFSSTRIGKRSMDWRADKPATLYFVEALDGGDQSVKAEYRDMMYTWEAPFNNEPKQMIKVPQRFAGVIWGDDNTAILRDMWYDTRMTSTYIFSPSSLSLEPKMITRRNRQDVYSDPGSFETRKNQYGRYVLAIENGNLLLIGDGYTKEGQFPFIDEFNLKTLKTKRIYQSEYKDKKEDIISITDFKKGIALVRIQSKRDYPNYYLRNFRKKSDPQMLTNFPNPFKKLERVHKEVIKYRRNDGVVLSGTLYLPENYNKNSGEKLPLLIWAYPEEFKDASSASQSTHNPNEFTAPSYGSFVYWVVRGYAVLDDASFPIIGEGSDEPNDTFVEQLVANAKAAIDAVDSLGYIDRNRVGVGGHSYGAFMTANLLSHSNLFAVGIARSGAYNRTLTPFGFQNEQRNYWDAPNVYNTMSPFMNAFKMKTPMLLVHGEADNNPGTFTLQTERYFQALKGLGAPVRMVILPKESHGYAAKENILHLLWEQDQFFEKYLKK